MNISRKHRRMGIIDIGHKQYPELYYKKYRVAKKMRLIADRKGNQKRGNMKNTYKRAIIISVRLA